MDAETLQRQLRDALAIREMIKSEGWKVFDKALDEQYSASISALIEKEDAEVRSMLKGIIKVRRILSYLVELGKKANDELNKKTQGE